MALLKKVFGWAKSLILGIAGLYFFVSLIVVPLASPWIIKTRAEMFENDCGSMPSRWSRSTSFHVST